MPTRTLPELIAEVAKRQRGGHPLRMPVGVIGPRQATPAQVDAARAVGRGIAEMGLVLLCGGRGGVMEGACQGAAEAGGIAIGVLPDAEAGPANPYATVVLATGIGEARNAVIARAALCLVAIGDNFGTLSEVALGRQFGKLVIGLEGAAQVEGVVQLDSCAAALEQVARCALGAPTGH
ncbi:MAG: lysine decarboxylase [Burkholderiales bacterium]|nr:lysine decarboxylase [Burkholderiales bacterium]